MNQTSANGWACPLPESDTETIQLAHGGGGRMMDRLLQEPALVTGFIGAVIALAVGFGLGWSGEQVALVMTVVEAGMAILVRALSTPTGELPFRGNGE